jgi:hypothetical protein
VTLEVRGECLRSGRVDDDQVLEDILEPGPMGEEVTECHGPVASGGKGKVEVRRDVPVEVQVALLDQLHHRLTHEQFRDGSHAEAGSLRVDRPSRSDVRNAIALHEDGLAIPDHDHDGAGESRLRESAREIAVEPRLEVGRLQPRAAPLDREEQGKEQWCGQ